MIDHLEIAKRFVREQLEERDDIIGVLLCGSVARGEETETSDIDLSFYTGEEVEKGSQSQAWWEEDVFIDLLTTTTKGLGSLEEAMGHPISATHMNDALILYDPTGFFGALQDKVRAVYMDSRWLRLRLNWALARYRTGLASLRDAVSAADDRVIRQGAWWLPHAAASVPLYSAGQTPSSTRKLLQLTKVSPEVRVRVIELECSLSLTEEDVVALVHTCTSYHALLDHSDREGLHDYMLRKATFAARHGELSEAVDVLWCAMGLGKAVDEHREQAAELAREWLCGVGWEGADALQVKLWLAESLLRDLEAMAEAAVADAQCECIENDHC